ncbi:hypothetical protein JYU34_000374, partial [Plutella xylostella]
QRAVLKVMMSRPFRYSTRQLYLDSNLLTVRQLYVLKVVLRRHSSLSTEMVSRYSNSRTGKNIIPTTKHRTYFSGQNYFHQSARIYNKINKQLGIYSHNKHECKNIVTEFLLKLSYDDTENLLKPWL